MTLAGSSIPLSLSLIAPLVNRSSDSGSCWYQMVAIAVCVPEQQVASTKVRVKPQKLIGNKIRWNIVEAVLGKLLANSDKNTLMTSKQAVSMSLSKIIGALRVVALAASSFSSLVVSPTCCRCPRSWQARPRRRKMSNKLCGSKSKMDLTIVAQKETQHFPMDLYIFAYLLWFFVCVGIFYAATGCNRQSAPFSNLCWSNAAHVSAGVGTYAHYGRLHIISRSFLWLWGSSKAGGSMKIRGTSGTGDHFEDDQRIIRLGGGWTNPFEKYESNWIISPGRSSRNK